MTGQEQRQEAGPSTPTRAGTAVLVLGVLLTAAGAAAVVAARRVDAGVAPRLVGGNLPVNAGATDRLDVRGHNSPALVGNPTDPANLVVGNRIDSPRFSCALHVSFDGGGSWEETALPLPEGRTVACFSPDVAFAADGTLFVAFTSFGPADGQGNVPDALWLATSRDGGRTLSAPSQVSGPLAFQVRVVADRAAPGRVYLAWLQGSATTSWGFAAAGNPIVVVRSDDAGATWTEPTRVNPTTRERVVAPSLVVDERGDVHLAYLDVGDDRLDYHGGHEGQGGDPYPGSWSLVAAASPDGGATWRESVVERSLVPTQRFLILFPPTPSLAWDDRGRRLYVGFHDGRHGDADVWVWRSDDRGRTWEEPRRVNDTPRSDLRAQYLPALAVSPDARLDVIYYDRRADGDDVMNEVSLQSSVDGGRSFSSRLRLSERRFDSRVGFGSERGMPDLGNRLGLLATARGSLAIWSDTRGGVQLTGKQDLASAIVGFPRPDAWLRVALRWGGLSAGVLGVALTAAVLRRLRRQRR